jgi:DNA-binding NarL/FixJ family response regulator
VFPVTERAALRLILADDHHLVRAGLRALVDSIEGVEVVGEAGDGLEAMDMTRALVPDIVLADIAMPRMNGLALLREIRAASLPVKVLLLTMHDNDEYVAEAVRQGASGYLVKNSALEELGLALRALQNGDIYLSPSVVRKLTLAVQGERTALTKRQTDVLRLIARGQSSKEIARELGLSLKTVETHRSQIMDRLGIRDLAGLVRYAGRTGLINFDD